MGNVNTKGKEQHTFDAIVVGSGMSGGWAAKELCEKGLKTLVLERGRNIEHIKDYPTANMAPWEFEHHNQLTAKDLQENPIASRCYAYTEATRHFFVKDNEHPYIQIKPFDWIKAYQVGGKSLLWARWTQRWSDLDFEANAKEGIAIDWPIRYKDISPWYSYVEKFVGISGNRDGIPHLPDGEFQPPMEMNCLEQHFKQAVESGYKQRHVIISRTANLTKGLKGRGPCQYRDLCFRGCPFAGYFSSVSATIPAAEASGNLTLRPFSVVHSIIYDDTKQKATGVRVIDANTHLVTDYFAKVIFVNAGTLNTTLILKNSVSARFPDGLGNQSGVLGHYLMDHNYRGRVFGEYDGFQDKYTYGRRPTGIYIPRFTNLNGDKRKDYIRGFAYAGNGSRETGKETDQGIGARFKESMSEPGNWQMQMVGMGECLPYYENKVTLSKTNKDAWGMPLLEIDCSYKDNELKMLKEILSEGMEMMETAGFKNVGSNDSGQAPGLGIHEMGTARMGRDMKTSVLNEHNQVWGASNVFVTDGACMTSTACQNPSLTYMALTARAADYAFSQLKKNNL
ncbi:MAG TPA: GMC family oxidoreductase [Puia sp.]|jgi:choline dehydrogenase-like flavoprotein